MSGVQRPPVVDFSDLTAAWPTMSSSARRHAMRARMLGTDRSMFARVAKLFGFAWKPVPPSARRAAERALVLAAIASKAFGEQNREHLANSTEPQANPMSMLQGLGVAGELERQERDFLKARVGKVDKTYLANASWRVEGFAVLAWALNRFDLPPYDEAVDRNRVHDCIGFSNPDAAREFLAKSTFRPTSEIDRVATHAILVNWRLRTYRMYPGPWDFVRHLRNQPSFNETWLENLSIVDGDLAIGNQCIFKLSLEEIERYERIAVERQIAAYWLQGDNSIYSKIDPSTLLSSC